jgi:carbon storage regulator CsrA
VKITVLSFDRGVVRLGIEAPKTIPVHRKEIHDKIVKMNKEASKTEFAALKHALTGGNMIFSDDNNGKNRKSADILFAQIKK